MIKKGNQPITGTPLPRRTRPVLGDQARTSSTAQRQIRQPDVPMQDPALRVPAPTQRENRANPNFAKEGMRFGGTGKSVSIHNRPTVDLSAVGEPRLPRGYNPIISGFPTSGAQRTAGKISTNAGPQANAKEMRRVRQTYPGIFGRGR
jgi:hypothetical protein